MEERADALGTSQGHPGSELGAKKFGGEYSYSTKPKVHSEFIFQLSNDSIVTIRLCFTCYVFLDNVLSNL